MRYAINRDGCVAFESGETPFPVGSAWPVSETFISTPLDQLKIVAGVLELKTEEELRIQLLPAKYRTDGGLDADGNRIWIEKTPEEKAQADADEEAQKKAEEQARQDAKPLALKAVENKFLAMCDQLTGTASHTKLGFGDIQIAIDAIPDPATKMMVSVQLLAIDAEAKREGGNLWWDDCTWHADIMG